MANHGIEIPAPSVKPRTTPATRHAYMAQTMLRRMKSTKNDDHEREVEHPHRRDQPPQRAQHRLGEIGEEHR